MRACFRRHSGASANNRLDEVIAWTSDETHVLLNPRLPRDERAVLERAAAAVDLRSHVFVASSGSTGTPRLVALSKTAILESARAVNRRLDTHKSDTWCCVLPTFHVGGIGIHARAFVSGARVVSALWNAAEFISLCGRERVTLSALVPAQVVDLVRGSYRSPVSLRGIVIGGGALSEDVYAAARELGWPVMPSYGLTEACSQVATAKFESPDLVLLDHWEARSDDGRIAIKGPSLLTGYVDERGLSDPKRDGWFYTSDLGHVQGRTLRVEGRVDDVVKIGGELVNVARLEALLETVRGSQDAALVVVSDDRLGSAIHLAATSDARELTEAFNRKVLPFERIRQAHQIALIPRTALGKIRRAELRRIIEKRSKTPE